MADIYAIIDKTHDFFKQKNIHVFGILPHKTEKRIQVYINNKAFLPISSELQSFNSEHFPEYRCRYLNLNNFDRYMHAMQQEKFVEHGLSSPDISNNLFSKAEPFLEEILGNDIGLCRNVVFYDNDTTLTKMDYIVRCGNRFAFIAVQEIKGQNTSKNTRRKHKKIQRASEFAQEHYSLSAYLFRLAISDKGIEVYKISFQNKNKRNSKQRDIKEFFCHPETLYLLLKSRKNETRKNRVRKRKSGQVRRR